MGRQVADDARLHVNGACHAVNLPSPVRLVTLQHRSRRVNLRLANDAAHREPDLLAIRWSRLLGANISTFAIGN